MNPRPPRTAPAAGNKNLPNSSPKSDMEPNQESNLVAFHFIAENFDSPTSSPHSSASITEDSTPECDPYLSILDDPNSSPVIRENFDFPIETDAIESEKSTVVPGNYQK